VDLKFKGARVISNPKGYPKEETGFTENLMVEILDLCRLGKIATSYLFNELPFQ